MLRCISALGTALVTTMGFAACGASTRDSVLVRDSVVVRVGENPITTATLDHWMSVKAPGPVTPDPPRYIACIAHGQAAKSAENQPRPSEPLLKAECQRQYQTLKQHVLSFLISSDWLIGEADDRGEKITGREIDRRVEEKNHESFPNGEGELREFLNETGQTVADLRLTTEIELASAKIRQEVLRKERKVTRAQIAAYYRENKQRFVVPESRRLELVEVKSEAAARKAKQEIESGKTIASMAPIHESIERFGKAGVPGGASIEKAIFSAKPNVLAGPLKLRFVYSVYEVRGITPASHKALAQVENSIRKKLVAEEHRQVIAEFSAAWRKKWTARTSCSSEFMVQQCSQYKGARASPPEDPFSPS